MLKRERGSNVIGLKSILGLSMALMMSLGFATDAFAQEEITRQHDVKVNIKGSGLHLETSDVIPFKDVVLDKERKTYSTSFENNKVTVADLRGDYYSNSWKLTVQAEPLTMYSEDGYSRYSLPEGSLVLSDVDRYDYYGDAYYFDIDGDIAIDDGEVTIAKASGYGGVFNIYYPNDALKLTIDPTTAVVGEYETTLIWTLYPYDDETVRPPV